MKLFFEFLLCALTMHTVHVAGMMSEADLAAHGIQNCPNKCDKVFDRTQYAISDQPNADTFEFRSCIIGCNFCNAILTNNASDTCFTQCKQYNYGKSGIRKGVIEPDKACITGCMINTCQGVCVGGTTDNVVTPNNQGLWWGLGGNGCSIKSLLGYVQAPSYGNPNGPSGQGSTGIQKCCAQALNLCGYTGPTDTTNYANVVLVAQRACKQFVGSSNTTAICNFYKVPQNCGTQGLGPTA